MAKKKAIAVGKSAVAEAVDGWAKVTWPQLVDQFDQRTASRGEKYQQSGWVRQLCRSATGSLLAWVDGSDAYATRVQLTRKGQGTAPKIVGECSCPVSVQCKHAVAVVLQALAEMEAGRDIPLYEPAVGDERLELLSAFNRDVDPEDSATAVEDEFGFPKAARLPARQASTAASTVVKYVENLSEPEARRLLRELVENQPEVRERLERQLLLNSAASQELVQRTRQELRRVTANPVWRKGWRDLPELPDFSLLQQLLKRLSELGLHDELLEIGRELIERGLRQVSQSDDDGMLSGALCRCLNVVFESIPFSTLPAPERMLYAIEALLNDDYGICESAGRILNQPCSAADWSVVADQLASRVDRNANKRERSSSDWNAGYRRTRVTRRLIEALENAGRSAEALQWYEIEAEENCEYVAYCQRLKELRRYDDLQTWIKRGIAATNSQWFGIAEQLRTMLVDEWKRQKLWGLVAAAAANEFCRSIGLCEWKELMSAALKAGRQAEVREAMLWHLDRERLPDLTADASESPGRKPRSTPAKSTSRVTAPAWPLPPLPVEFAPPERPPAGWQITAFLIDLAIDERRLDDVIALYESVKSNPPVARDWGANPSPGDRTAAVAAALSDERPEYALRLRQKLLEDALVPTGEAAYGEVIAELKRIRALLARLHREPEFERLVDRIRTEHRRRRILVKRLDRLINPRIVANRHRQE